MSTCKQRRDYVSSSYLVAFRMLFLCAVLAVSGQNMISCDLVAGERPNLLLILTDDQGYGDLAFHGNEKIDTPVMDRLARESARFERFMVCPLCSMTRATLLTGRYNLRTGCA